jgi:hypothetical protein
VPVFVGAEGLVATSTAAETLRLPPTLKASFAYSGRLLLMVEVIEWV